MEHCKSHCKREVYSAKAYLKKQEKSQINNLNLHLKELEKEQNPKVSRRKEIIKIIAEGFPSGAVVENLPANAGDTGPSTGLGRSHMPWSN